MITCQLGDVGGLNNGPPKMCPHPKPKNRECDLIRKMVFEDVSC